MPLQFAVTNANISVIVNGKIRVIAKDSPQFKPLKAALQTKNWAEAEKHLSLKSSVKSWASGELDYTEAGGFSYKGTALPEAINKRMVEMAAKQESPLPLFRFWKRLQKNPSYRSVEQLWAFLDHQGIPLTSAGTFLAYKGVTDDLKDAHSKTISNKPGVINEMPRNQVSDDPRTPCHEGFHVGDLSYAKSFASRVVVCEVDPEHVVSVPYDQSHRKMRVCRYKVLGFHNGQLLPSTIVEDADLPVVETAVMTHDTEKVEKKVAASREHAKQNNVKKASKKSKRKAARKVKVAAAVAKKVAEIAPHKPGAHAFDDMEFTALMVQSIEDLRTYATKHCAIVGASKIAGGKAALVRVILEARM